MTPPSPPPISLPRKRPNFLIIVADDLGFSDTSPYGSEISTPNIGWLAESGVRMTDFHTAPTCSPTRSMLFSGTDNHIAGLGAMWEQMKRGGVEKYEGKRGYEGYLNWDVAALSEVMKEAGYWTALSGKWHLGLTAETSPHARGFQKAFTYLAGAGSHYNHEPQLASNLPRTPSFIGSGLWMEDSHFLDREKDLPTDFYSSRTFTDKLVSFLRERSAEDKEKPFLACLTYTAPHWPLQAPPEVIAKYKGKYDGGPEVLRQSRLAALRQLKLVPENVTPAPVLGMGTTAWNEMTPEERAKSARAMEIFAAMVDEMDTQIGRVLDYLRDEDGSLDDTFVLFMSDNGAEGQVMEAMPVLNGVSMAEVIAKYYDNSLENMGRKTSFVWYGPRWSSAATAPSRGHKMSTNEGGIRCPCIIRYPPLIPLTSFPSSEPHLTTNTTFTPLTASTTTHAFTNVMDIMPTILSLAQIQHPFPSTFQSRTIVPMRGKSWVPLLSSQASHVYNEDFDFTAWELFGNRAVRKGRYKAVLQAPPRGTGEWELFDLSVDPGELNNLAIGAYEGSEERKILDGLIRHYETYYQETGMFDAGLAIEEARRKIKSVGKVVEGGGLHGFRGR